MEPFGQHGHNNRTHPRLSITCRWMEFKSRDANRLNAENDEQYQKQQTKIRKELQEAANERVDIKLRYFTGFTKEYLKAHFYQYVRQKASLFGYSFLQRWY